MESLMKYTLQKIMGFIFLLCLLNPVFSLDKVELHEEITESRKEWKKLNDELSNKKIEYENLAEKSDKIHNIYKLLPIIDLNNKKAQLQNNEIELNNLNWKIWNLALEKDKNEKEFQSLVDAKNKKEEEIREQKQEIRDLGDKLENKDINLKQHEEILSFLDENDNKELLKVLKERDTTQKILHKYSSLVPNSVNPLTFPDCKGNLLELKTLEEKKFKELTKQSVQLTENLQKITKSKLADVSKSISNIKKEIQEIQNTMKKQTEKLDKLLEK